MKVLIPIAHGSESLETVTLVNVLRRASLPVVVASIEATVNITGTRGIRLTADVLFDDVREQDFDLIVVPGGEGGADALGKHAPLIDKLRRQRDAGKLYAAICAAPALTLAPNDLLGERQATCYPAFQRRLPRHVDAAVVEDGSLVTSQGPGTAIEFALKLVERLAGGEVRDQVAAQMLA